MSFTANPSCVAVLLAGYRHFTESMVNGHLPNEANDWGVMTMNKLLSASVALLALGLSVPAKAADMPVKYVAPAPIFTWSGCYVGATIGYKWGKSKHHNVGSYNGRPLNRTAGYDLTPTFDVDGVVGGGEGGCNYQIGNWVWGVEVDGSWASAEGQANNILYPGTATATLPDFFNPGWTSKTSERWLATARGRLGWAADRWMWYVTGGAAWTGVDISTNNLAAVVANGNSVRQFANERVNKIGWVVGVGTEYALLGGWSVKSELLYADFGTFRAFEQVPVGLIDANGNIFGGCGNPAAALPGTGQCSNRDIRLHEFIWRVGMNYRFDWASFR